MRVLKERPCKECGKLYTPTQSMQTACGWECARELGRRKRTKHEANLERKRHRELMARDRQWKRDNKPMRDVWRDTQTAVNAYIRTRDAGKPCISCGRSEAQVIAEDMPGPGGLWDAGHFLGRGAYPEKRYLLTNIWRQCKKCNGGSKHAQRFQSDQTISQQYRINLTARIGEEAMARLDAPRPPLKPTREWCYRLAALMRKRTRLYEGIRLKRGPMGGI